MNDEHIETPMLKPSELYVRRRTQDSAKLKAYNQILAQIYHRIEVLSQMPNCPFYTLYTVPPFILGLPKIDLEDCVVYLIYQLRMAGFETRYTYPNLIYISWQNHEKNYIIQDSPIMKAMLDSTEKARREAERNTAMMNKRIKKIQGKARGNGGISGGGEDMPAKVGGLYTPHLAGRNTLPRGILKKSVAFQEPVKEVGKLPSTADYVPPASFLTTMERPSVRKEAPNGLSSDLFMGIPPTSATFPN
jgi:hypothetical protein